MMRSILLLSSAAMASASSSIITVANANANAKAPSSAPSNHQHQRFQQQSRQQHEREEQLLLWYPSFSSAASSRDEGGTCITSPLSAISAHFAIPGVDYDFDIVDDDDSVNVEIMASSTKEGCCAAWFPDQDGCACSGDCDSRQQQQQQWEEDGDDNDVVLWDEHDWQLWNDDAAAAAFENQEEEEEEFFYPVFREAYEDSGCAKAVINNNDDDDDDDDEFLTESGCPLHSSWLHPSRADCCREWFGEQESQSCYLTDLNNLGEADGSSVKVNEGVNVTMTAGKAVVC